MVERNKYRACRETLAAPLLALRVTQDSRIVAMTAFALKPTCCKPQFIGTECGGAEGK